MFKHLVILSAIAWPFFTIANPPTYWFITHLQLRQETKHLQVSITPFDPVVRVYDEDSKELIASLQRITIYGQNAPTSVKEITFKTLIQPNGAELLRLFYRRHLILSLEVGGPEQQLFSYDPHGKIDLEIATPDNFVAVGSLLRLYPSAVIKSATGDFAPCFRWLQEEEARRTLEHLSLNSSSDEKSRR